MKSIQLSTSAVTSIASMHTTRDQSTAVSPQTTWLSSSLLASSNTDGSREPLQSLIIGASVAVVIAVVIVIASLIIIGAYW